MQIYSGTNPKKRRELNDLYRSKKESCFADLSYASIPREDEEPRQYASNVRA